jgi:ABC-2 type transport system ATP-binding protein
VSAIVELRGLTKRFGRRTALHAIDLELEDQQIAGIVGSDGAGKTTLVRSLAGLLEIEAQKATVLGHDLRGDVTALKAEIGYVPQSFSLHRDLSVIENLRFTARLQRLSTDELHKRAGELLERTGLAPFADRAAGALSGGMKQKLAVVNALLLRPRILLLDEPTAGVDVLARTEIWSMLAAARAQALVVISTSYLNEAASCDRLVYLEGGRIVADDTPQRLRATVPLQLFRAWSDDPRAMARAARTLPYVRGARQTGGSTRIEVSVDHSPGRQRLHDDLGRLPGARVHFVEQLTVDMETTFLHLSRLGTGT